MKLYFDAFSNDEIISDSFPMEFIFERTGAKVKARWIAKGQVDVDIGCGNAFGGAGEEEKAADTTFKVLDVIDTFGYQETTFSKDDYKTYIKDYLKRVKERLDDRNKPRVEVFMKNAQLFVKWILSRFDDITFYTPASYDSVNIIILSLFENEDDDAPTFVYFVDGLREQKC